MENSYNPKIHHRRSIRLPAFDYSSAEQYFVTICAKEKKCIFGDVVNERMELNALGYIIRNNIKNTEYTRKDVHVYSFIVMPNHVHIIIQIKNDHPDVGARCARPSEPKEPAYARCPASSGYPSGLVHARGARSAPLRHKRSSLSSIVCGIKSSCTSTIRIMERDQTLCTWQRNYYERIIRTDEELFDTIEYIRNNSRNWRKDPLYQS